ncbi:hypothetical protein FIBSPDRAFT_753451, partial [Athelia psychrophila]
QNIKDHALWLRSEGYISDDICNILGISNYSLHRWKNNLDNHSSVIPPPNPFDGCPQVLNADQKYRGWFRHSGYR